MIRAEAARGSAIALLLCCISISATAGGDARDDRQPLLPPCPDTPNCVSSVHPEKARRVPPLDGGESREQALQRLEAVLGKMPRVDWERTADNRIEAEFTSLLFRFVDDVTLVVDPDGRVDVRSASRTGHWDLGVNRRRVERLRNELEQIDQ